MTERPHLSLSNITDVDAELARFEAQQRAELGLPSEATKQWHDPLPGGFTKEQREHTTIMVCGLTHAHDQFIRSALSGIGYKVVALDVPDNDALQYGREFGNRGQCNPTYFTVGNLIKHLNELQASGLDKQEIIDKYIFLTAGACGPCRFGTYVTEYRKALRDSGFDNFRVMLFQQTGGLKQATGEEAGLQINPRFFAQVIQAIVLGDVLNALMYRIRPYEVQKGAADEAIADCKKILCDALENGTSIVPAVWKARRRLSQVKVDRTRIVPRVSIIGEFWAMTTEGDGNYHMQRFLEGEGAEVDVQLVTAWLLYMLWQARYDTQERAVLRGVDSESKFGLAGVNVGKKLVTLTAAEKAVRGIYQVAAHALGLYDYHLPDMDELADVSHAFYDSELRGGEGHMEVGKLIVNVLHSKVDMTLSVKPFGCMPSSSVSDGVQSMITELYPQAIFLPIETSGDGAVNVYSRVQMQLFKAKQLAQHEVQKALDEAGMTMEQVREALAGMPALQHPFHRSPHRYGCTAADLVAEVADRKRGRLARAKAKTAGLWTRITARGAERQRMVEVTRRAVARSRTKRAVDDQPSRTSDPATEGKIKLRVLAAG